VRQNNAKYRVSNARVWQVRVQLYSAEKKTPSSKTYKSWNKFENGYFQPLGKGVKVSTAQRYQMFAGDAIRVHVSSLNFASVCLYLCLTICTFETHTHTCICCSKFSKKRMFSMFLCCT
jgi:hypothetical protein